jgi:hypothetical protein
VTEHSSRTDPWRDVLNRTTWPNGNALNKISRTWQNCCNPINQRRAIDYGEICFLFSLYYIALLLYNRAEENNFLPGNTTGRLKFSADQPSFLCVKSVLQHTVVSFHGFQFKEWCLSTKHWVYNRPCVLRIPSTFKLQIFNLINLQQRFDISC